MFADKAASVKPPSTNGDPSTGICRQMMSAALKIFEVENARLKKLLAEAHLDLEALKVGSGVKR